MEDYDSIRKISRGKFTYAKFAKLKELAKNSVGFHNKKTLIYLFLHTSQSTLILIIKLIQ